MRPVRRFTHILLALALAGSATVASAAGTAGGTPAPRRVPNPIPTRRYVFALLRRGVSHESIAPARLDSLRAGHMANIGRMFADHRLVCAGPFLDDGDLQGVYIFDADSLAQVGSWLVGDPFLATGHMICELHPWIGPAGISEAYRKLVAADPARKDELEHWTLGLLLRGAGWATGDTTAMRDGLMRRLTTTARTRESGQILLAGPFEDHGIPCGVFVYATADTAEARRWSATDPAIASGGWRVELHPWMTGRGILTPPD